MKLIFLLAISGLFIIIRASPSSYSQLVKPIFKPECNCEYACQNLINAKSCYKVNHCIETVWKKRIYPTDDDPVCQMCLDVINDVCTLLKSNATEADVKAYFEEELCTDLKNTKRTECTEFIDGFVPVLIKMLKSGMSPNAICTTAELCNQAATDKLLVEASNEMLMPKKWTGVTASRKLLNNKCADGPVYWCQNIRTANICKAVAHCTQTVWKTKKYPTKNDPICQICLDLVQQMRDEVQSNDNQIELKYLLERICQSIVSKESYDECHKLIDDFITDLVEMLTSEMNPQVLCSAVGICSITKIRNLLAETSNENIVPTIVNEYQTKSNVENDQFCIICEYVLHMAQHAFTSQTNKKTIKETVINTCHTMPKNIRSECERFIHFFGNNAIEMIIQGIEPVHICTKLDVCIHSKSLFVDEKCPLCMYLIQSMKNEFGILCNVSSPDIYKKANCESLAQMPTPRQYCNYIDLCKEKEKNAIEHYMVNTKGSSGFKKMYQNDNYISSSDRLMKDIEKLNAKNSSDENCLLCLYLVSDFERQWNDMCDLVKIKSKVKGCSGFISNLKSKLADKMPSIEPTPHEVCLSYELCADQEETRLEHLGEKDSSRNVENGNKFVSPEHVLCEEILFRVEKSSSNYKSTKNINDALTHVCSSFYTKKFKNLCTKVIYKNLNYVANAINRKLTPRETCRGLELSDLKNLKIDDDGNEIAQNLMEKHTETPQCELCQLIMNEVEKELNINSTQKEIEKVFKSICVELPSAMLEDCDEFVETFVDLFVALVRVFPPKELCGVISLCRANQKQDTDRRTVLECAVCNAATNAFATVLLENENKSLMVLVKMSCSLLPSKYKQNCKQLLNVHFNSISNLIRKSEKITNICVKIEKCFSDGDNSMFFEVNNGSKSSLKLNEFVLITPKPKPYRIGAFF